MNYTSSGTNSGENDCGSIRSPLKDAPHAQGSMYDGNGDCHSHPGAVLAGFGGSVPIQASQPDDGHSFRAVRRGIGVHQLVDVKGVGLAAGCGPCEADSARQAEGFLF